MADTNIAPSEHYIETASATTDPDNATSGSFAYILTVVVLVALIVLCVALSGVVGAVAGRAIADSASSGSGATGIEQLLDPDDNGGSNSSGNGSQGSTSHGGSLSLSDALDLNLSIYDLDVDGQVSATSYANVPADVRTYVRGLLAADTKAQDELAKQLNTAARADDPSGSMQAVVDAANAGKAAIQATQEPSLGDDGLNRELTEARQALLDRWDAIIAEVGILNGGSDISYSKLNSADTDVQNKTQEAADDVTEALQTASGTD